MAQAKLKDGLRVRSDGEAAKWIARINASWRASVVAILETGNLLLEAKKALPHGRWLPMIKGELPFSARTAQSLMQIAKDERIKNNIEQMPASWATLRSISQLSDRDFQRRLSDRTISPDMERSDILPARAVKSIGNSKCGRDLCISGGYVGGFSLGLVRRMIRQLSAINAKCGGADDSASVSDCLSDGSLRKLMESNQ